MPSSTALVRRPRFLGTKRVSTPSRSRKRRTKSATGSSPTAVSSAVFNPSRRTPTLMLVGQPPTNAPKLSISANGAPTWLEYRSIELLPMVRRS